jgi:sortase A
MKALRIKKWVPKPKSPGAKRWTARVLTGVSGLMVVGAVWFGLYPFYTDYRAEHQQRHLATDFRSNAAKTDYANRKVEEGEPLTRIEIPSLSLKTIVVEGVSARALAAGSGHYPMTPLPGEPGNVAIAGHSGMNGKPFDKLGSLQPGDVIYLVTPLARYTYQVTQPAKGSKNPWIVDPLDWSVVASTPEPSLTLTTCWPRGSAKKRLVARARLIETRPVA